MKGKRELKRHLATALIVAVMSTQGVAASAAPTSAEDGFQLNEDQNWTYWKDGQMVTNEFVEVKKDEKIKWYYYFKDDGTMASDELFERNDLIPDDNKPGYESYAFKNGQIAMGMWIQIEDGKISTSAEGDSSWYFFEEEEGTSIKDGPKMIGKDNRRWYHFDEDGVMTSRDFAEIERGRLEDNETDDELVTCFFEYQGQRAENKWLNIKGDWYRFDEKGIVNTAPLDKDCNVATGSNATGSNAFFEFDSDGALISDIAPYPAVEGIIFSKNEELHVQVGDKMELEFDVQLATGSNVLSTELSAESHDIWTTNNSDFEFSGSYELGSPKLSDGKFKVTYTPKEEGAVGVKAVIDGIESDRVVIHSSWGDKSDSAKISRIEELLDLLDKEEDTLGKDPLNIVQNIRNILESMKDSSSLKPGWLKKEDSVRKLENDYQLASGVDKTESVTAAAKNMLVSDTAEIVGAALNADEGTRVEFTVDRGNNLNLPVAYPMQRAFDLNCGDLSEFDIPVIVKMPLPRSMSTDGLVLYHEHNGEISQMNFTISGNTVSFVTDGMSTFAFAGKAASGGGSGGSGGGGGGSSSLGASSTAGVVTTDAKKGQVNSVTGIITGNGDGYSKWDQDEKGWKLQYADGTFAAGTMLMDENGKPYEQPAWELINGAWYPFGADGYIKGGLVYDPALGGTFYVDINSGMKTGWQSIDGVWYYFNPNSDGKRGVMLTDTWVDGYYIDPKGVWNGEEKVTAS